MEETEAERGEGGMCEGRQNLQASSLGTQLHTGDVCSQEENLEGKPPTMMFKTSDPGSQVFVADGCLVTRQTLSVSSWAECLSQAWFQSDSCTHLLPSTCGGPASTCNFPSNVHSQPRRAPDLAFCMRLQAARTEPASAKGKSDIHPVHPKRQFQQK